MIRSMTGFGRGSYENEGREYLVEVKSVNHKYCDINFRMPKSFSGIENKLRKLIEKYLSRGKIDIFIDFQNFSDAGNNIKFNKELAKAYIKNLKELGEETGINSEISVVDISKMPDIFKKEDNTDEELIYNELSIALNEALKNIVTMKEIEGEKLKIDLEARIEEVFGKINEISNFSSGLVQEYIVKLKSRVKELMDTETLDENRLLQEIVIFSDKSSIEEELTRLKSHVEQFKRLIKESSPIGKKLDFLIQEMNREINTIGSKANSLQITNLVIEVKTELENIREQIQNIE